MSGNNSKKIAFNYFGGKFTWLDNLYDNFPSDFIHFVDLFGGSFVVGINCPFKCIKTANELNKQVTDFFEVLRDNQTELIRLIELTPCSNEEYLRSWESTDNKIENARRFYVRVRQSFFGLGCQRKNKGWHMAKTQLNSSTGETVSKLNNSIPKLVEVAEVIRENFQITNFSYKDAIEKIDFPGAFFYADPPYRKESRKSFNDYLFEFTDEDHIELAGQLNSIQGKFMISSYDNDLYNELYKDCNKVVFPSKKNNIRSGEVTEVIWMNYKPKKDIDLFTIN